MRRLIVLLSATCSAFSAWGCGSDSGPDTPPEPAVCDAPGYHVDSDALSIERVQASVVDPSGAPAASLPVQVCGLNQCFNGMSSATGQVNVTPGASLELPAFKYGDGFDYAEFAVLLGPAARQNLGRVVALPLPDFASGTAFPSHGRVQNGDLGLTIASGSSVVHDLLSYDPTQLVFRSAELPLDADSISPDPSLGFERVFGVAPLGTTFCPPAKLTVQNRAGWAPGSNVAVYVQGLDVAEKWAPYAGWLEVAEARVVSDGSVIETTSGGIPILSSIALRRK